MCATQGRCACGTPLASGWTPGELLRACWWSAWASCSQKSLDKQQGSCEPCHSPSCLSDPSTESGCNYTMLWERKCTSIAVPRITVLGKTHLCGAWRSTLHNAKGSSGAHISFSHPSKIFFWSQPFCPSLPCFAKQGSKEIVQLPF